MTEEDGVGRRECWAAAAAAAAVVVGFYDD